MKGWASGLRTGLDVLFWETEYEDGLLGNAVRFDLYFRYDS